MDYTPKELFKLFLPEGTAVSDEKTDAFLLRAENTIKDITGRNSVPEQLYDVQAEIALIYFNRSGTEGETRRSEGEITADFERDLPQQILRRLRNYPRKVGVLGAADTEQA